MLFLGQAVSISQAIFDNKLIFKEKGEKETVVLRINYFIIL